MAVAYDNSAVVDDFGAVSLTTPSFTIAGSNRAACLGLTHFGSISAISGSCGGQSASAISGASLNEGTDYIELWKVIAPATGSQTASMSWTTNRSCSLSVITFTGVDQTTPFDGGTANSTAFGTTVSVSVTSTSGDMTTTCCMDDNADSGKTSSQTKKTFGFGCGDIGPGTGTTSHLWTTGGATTMVVAGANAKAAGGGASTTRGTPFGHCGTAFAGGRALQGILQAPVMRIAA